MLKLALLLLWAGGLPAAKPSFQVEVSGPPPGSAQAPALILIPGLASSGEVWNETVARYRARYQCHVLTLPGFAGVAPVEGPLLPRMVAELAQYIQAKKLSKPILIGHSLGGTLSLMFAAKYPTIPGGIVIVDAVPHLAGVFGPGFDPGASREYMRKQTPEQYEGFVRSGKSFEGMLADREHLPKLVDWSLRSDRTTVIEAMHEIMTTDLRQDIAGIICPTLVLGSWAGMKSFTTREIVEGNYKQQYAQLPGYRLAMAEKAQHFIMYDDPAWFFSQVDAALGWK